MTSESGSEFVVVDKALDESAAKKAFEIDARAVRATLPYYIAGGRPSDSGSRVDLAIELLWKTFGYYSSDLHFFLAEAVAWADGMIARTMPGYNVDQHDCIATIVSKEAPTSFQNGALSIAIDWWKLSSNLECFWRGIVTDEDFGTALQKGGRLRDLYELERRKDAPTNLLINAIAIGWDWHSVRLKLDRKGTEKLGHELRAALLKGAQGNARERGDEWQQVDPVILETLKKRPKASRHHVAQLVVDELVRRQITKLGSHQKVLPLRSIRSISDRLKNRFNRGQSD